jgi:hypothetical protein
VVEVDAQFICGHSRMLFAGPILVRGLMSDEEWAFFAPFVIEAGL